MSTPLSGRAFNPVWLVVVALFVLSGAPMTFATGVLLLIGLGVAPAIVLIWWNRPSPAVAEVAAGRHELVMTIRADRIRAL